MKGNRGKVSEQEKRSLKEAGKLLLVWSDVFLFIHYACLLFIFFIYTAGWFL